MVIKVDFDLTMSILTYNIFKLLAMDLDRYEKLSPQSLYEMFLDNSADIEIKDEEIIVALKKKRNLPLVLEKMSGFANTKIELYIPDDTDPTIPEQGDPTIPVILTPPWALR